jgi:hypothetical protein
MKIIGLGHISRVGKDSLANFILDRAVTEGYSTRIRKQSFAWKLKQITHDLYAWAGMCSPEHYETKEGEKDRDIVLPELGKTPVQVWVDFGTKAVREQVYQETWTNYLLKSNQYCDALIIPDVRFPNETQAIKDLGGMLVKVVRPGYGPRNTVADRALLGYDGWDLVVGRTGEMEELRLWGYWIADWLSGVRSEPWQSPESRAAALAVERVDNEIPSRPDRPD